MNVFNSRPLSSGGGVSNPLTENLDVATYTITSSGNINISTGGYVDIGGAAQTLAYLNSTNTASYLRFGNSGATGGYIGYNSSGNMVFQTAATTRMTIESGGDIGVGTSFPVGKFGISQAAGATNGYGLSNSGDGKDFYLSISATDTLSIAENAGTAVINFHDAGGVTIGSPTGGDKGAGTLNATAVYDDNVLLTCYPFDQYLDGTISNTKWDSKVPDKQVMIEAGIVAKKARPEVLDDEGNVIEEAVPAVEGKDAVYETVPGKHEDMRKFKARIGTQYDPMDIDKYAQHWKDKRHLSSLPNEDKFDPNSGMATGSWIQRLIETVELQAIHIENLNQRLKALEGN